MKGLVVAGIGTEVGKSIASAVLCEALGARYWKPVASGAADGPAESVFVSGLLSGGVERVFPETYLFQRSLSPHVAAALEGREVLLEELKIPASSDPVVVELAGGIMVPLNNSETNLDLLKRLRLPVVVVSRHYLGSINHTLLTLEVLRAQGIEVRGIIFNGNELPDTERTITSLGRVEVIGKIPHLEEVNAAAIRKVASTWNVSL
jgi:dethiobiotin synthetase